MGERSVGCTWDRGEEVVDLGRRSGCIVQPLTSTSTGVCPVGEEDAYAKGRRIRSARVAPHKRLRARNVAVVVILSRDDRGSDVEERLESDADGGRGDVKWGRDGVVGEDGVGGCVAFEDGLCACAEFPAVCVCVCVCVCVLGKEAYLAFADSDKRWEIKLI